MTDNAGVVLVSGAAGAIGSHVVRVLLERGIKTVGYDLSADRRFMSDLVGRFEMVPGDVLDLPLLMEVVSGFKVDYIVHTAALLPDQARANAHRAVQVNVVGTTNVVEAARRFAVRRLVFTSTKGVLSDFTGEYGHPVYRPVTPDYPVISPDNTHTLYNDTKLFCEHYLHKCVKMFDLDVVMLRFATIYGPGRIRHGNRALLGMMIENAVRGLPTRIRKGGEERSDFVYLKDVASACVLACFARYVRHRVFHIGSGRLLSLAEAARILKQSFPGAKIEVGPGLDPMELGFNSAGLLDISRARQELEYEPRYPFEEAVADYAAAMKDLGLV